MHEFGVMTYLLQGVEEKARDIGARRVVAINVVIGDRSSIVDDALLYYFDMMTPGTLAEGAQLNVRRVQSQFYCSACDSTFVPTGTDFRCTECRSLGHVTEQGSELLVESIEIEKA